MSGVYGGYVREAFVGLWNFVATNPFDVMVITFSVYGVYALYREFRKKKVQTTPA